MAGWRVTAVDPYLDILNAAIPVLAKKAVKGWIHGSSYALLLMFPAIAFEFIQLYALCVEYMRGFPCLAVCFLL
jgi:hypothetical protein